MFDSEHQVLTVPRPLTAAFTLVEMIISVALGTFICVTAWSALRAATGAVTVATRLSLENRLMRAGISDALDDIDFWTTMDDPALGGAQPLRGPGRAPFAAMTFDPDADGAKPRAWWRGTSNGHLLNDQPASLFGNDGLLSRVDHPDPERRWLPERISTISRTLGWYGMIDYLPANSIFSYVGNDGKRPAEICLPGQGDPLTQPYAYLPIWGYASSPRGILYLTHGASFGVSTDPDLIARGVSAGGFCDYIGGTVVAWDPYWASTTWHTRGPVRRSLTPVSPAHWPKAVVMLRRYVTWCRFVNLAQVALSDPVTGVTTRLQVTSLGTTLRGARQQRGLDQ